MLATFNYVTRRIELICNHFISKIHQNMWVVAPCLNPRRPLRALFLVLVSHYVTSDASTELFDKFVIQVVYSSCTINFYVITTQYILMLEEMNIYYFLIPLCTFHFVVFFLPRIVQVLRYLCPCTIHDCIFYSITSPSLRGLRPWMDPGLEVQDCSLSWPQSMVLLQQKGR